MKILAPLRGSDEVAPLVAAGAHEFYCGVAPPDWESRFGNASVHRRSARSAGVASVGEMQQIVEMAGIRPVFATLNAQSYPVGAIDVLADFGRVLVEEVRVAALIVAEIELVLALRERGLAGRIHVSSLACVRNREAALFYRDLGVARVILPRQVTLSEIAEVASSGVECEAFVLNDGCAFEEGTCATTHAFEPFCVGDRVGRTAGRLHERYAFWKWTLDNCGSQTSRGYTLGPCGLCALPHFARIGIASLKVVGREAPLSRKVASVRLAAVALDRAQHGADPLSIRGAVVAERGAPELCERAHLCYYPDVWKADVARLPEPAEAC